MATMTLRINEEDSELIKKYIQLHGLTISEFARQSMIEKIEDEYDLKILRQAMAEDDGMRISHEELMKEFGL
ncbi:MULTISPECIES: type II toxin-antitoxin system RelB family antitoxin [Streptococcus]|uniref:type II toxin-antitoxin system RelB family antitoxin n=1 Tax=Streptococcus TaxID=1301 RepID=UPI00345ADFD2